MGFWLPKLVNNHNVENGNGLDWVHNRSGEALDAISKGLDVANIGVQVVESVPSMWARATLFDTAINHQDGRTNSEVDRKIVGEWRGTLALLAFNYLSQFKLSFVPVDFNTAPELAKFKNLLPRNSILTDCGWEQIHIIMYGNKPFAITSPTTLVCAGTDYSQVFGNEILWFDGEKLTDPCTKLNDLHKKLLAYWLLNISEKMTQLTNVNMNNLMFKRINGMLESFRKDLGYANLDRNTFPDPNEYLVNQPHIMHRLYSFMSIPLDYRTDSSDILLISENPVEEPVLLYSDKMFNRESHDVIVFGATTLYMLQSMPPERIAERSIGNQSLTPFRLFRGEEWLFNDEVYLIDEEQMQPEYKSRYALSWTIQDEPRNAMLIYPFREEVLEYLKIDSIRDNTFVETLVVENERKLAVKIIVNLKGGTQEFKKVYNANQIHAFNKVPLSAVWPAYDLGENWNLYYFYNYRPYKSMQYGDFTLIPYQATDLKFTEDVIPTEIFTTTSYPKALLVKYNGLDLGFIPMVKPIEEINRVLAFENNCRIGIDFGTCSSTVFYSTDKKPVPSIFKYQQRSKTITKSLNNEYNFWEQFLPYNSKTPAVVDRYFHTLFRYYGDKPESGIVDGNIFYSYDIVDQSNVNYGGIADNLKWGADGSISARCSKPFLEQIVIQTLLEMILMKINVDTTKWFFSYPTALPKHRANSFRNNLSLIIKHTYERILGKTFGSNSNVHDVMTESIAAARYFLGTNAGIMVALAGGFISVDIGGGTTDISFWQSREAKDSYVYQTSVKMASRSLFIVPLMESKNRDRILEATGLRKSDASGIYNERPITIEEIELSLSKNKKAYEALMKVGEMSEIKRFIETVSIGIAGLFYYTGLLMKKLADEGEIKDFSPNIFFGGNGSNVFNWLNGGAEFSKWASRSELFMEMVNIAADFKSDVQINISATPKAEAAGGMVLQEVAIEENVKLESDSGIVIGEEMLLANGMQLTWDHIITSDLADKAISSVKLDNFKKFIDAYNTAYKKVYESRQNIINYNDSIHDKLTKAVKSAADDMKKKDEWNKPLFLVATELLVKDAEKMDLINI